MPPLLKAGPTYTISKKNWAFDKLNAHCIYKVADIDMPWQNLTLTIAADQAEEIQARLMTAGALSISLQDAGDSPVLEPRPGETPLWPVMKLTALFPTETDLTSVSDAIRAQYKLAQDPSVESVADQDWTRSWMDDFNPMKFGDRLWICPTWHTPPEPQATNLKLDPGLAFGTGNHPTTALCLQWLDQHLQPGAQVLDYGCGSGILAIAAIRLGAGSAWATDIDSQALTATRNNARLNDIPDQTLTIASPEALANLKADVVIANILSGPLITLADDLCNYIKPGGQLILSGILETQAETTAAAFSGQITWDTPESREGWVRLSGRRNHEHD